MKKFLVLSGLSAAFADFVPADNSLRNLKCNLHGIQMFLVKSFEVHSNMVDGSGDWVYPTVSDDDMARSSVNLIVRTCQAMRTLYLALEDTADHPDICSDAVIQRRNHVWDAFRTFYTKDFERLRGMINKDERIWMGTQSEHILKPLLGRVYDIRLNPPCIREEPQEGDPRERAADELAAVVKRFLLILDQWFTNLALNTLPQTIPDDHPFKEVLKMIDDRPLPEFSTVDLFGMRWDIVERLVDMVKIHPDPEQQTRAMRMAEIGIEKGSTFVHMLRTQKLGLIVGVDNYNMPEKPQAFNDELEGMYQNLTQVLAENNYAGMLVRKSSEEAFLDFPEGFFDIVFVDALHDFNNVKKDIVMWRSRIRSGGIIAGHDFSLWHPSVMFAVLSEAEHCFDSRIFLVTETVWFCFVK